MKKNKVIILGSTGSIGQNTIDIFKKDKKRFQIVALSTNKNISKVLAQANEFNVKNIIVNDFFAYNQLKKKNLKKTLKIYNSFSCLNKIFKKKEIFYTMIAITGIDGLKPSLDLIKLSQNMAIVNKEALICGWNLIKKKLKKFKTKFIPIDSEHFSINVLINDCKIEEIKKVYITASGGPFLDYSNLNLKKISLNDALNHPNWVMGKKISIDSSTMMNKVFEIIEAKNIFNIPYNKIQILIHPKSYIHSIIEFKNGLIKLIAHETDMMIPISNSIYNNQAKMKIKPLNLDTLNNLKLKNVSTIQFPLVKIIYKLPNFNSLYETALITINDYFVNLFLDKKINYQVMITSIKKLINNKEILKYRNIPVKNLDQILVFRDNLSLKLNNFVYKT